MAVADLTAELVRVRDEGNNFINNLNKQLNESKKQLASQQDEIRKSLKVEMKDTFVAYETELQALRNTLNHPYIITLKDKDLPDIDISFPEYLYALWDKTAKKIDELTNKLQYQPPENMTCTAFMGVVHLKWEEPVTNKSVQEYIVLRGIMENGKYSYSEACRVPGSKCRARLECWDVTGGSAAFRVCAMYEEDQWSACTAAAMISLPKHVKLQCRTPFDEAGLFSFIATCGGTKPYANPHSSGTVTASLSSFATDVTYSQAHKLVGRANDGYCCTDNRKASYMIVDIGENRRLKPLYYCLKNDGLGMYHVLRNWELQGKVLEDDEWVTLKRHVADVSLTNTAYATAGWKIERSSSVYRYFRIFQYDVNSYGAHNIMCCGIELYGMLYTSIPEEEATITVSGSLWK